LILRGDPGMGQPAWYWERRAKGCEPCSKRRPPEKIILFARIFVFSGGFALSRDLCFVARKGGKPPITTQLFSGPNAIGAVAVRGGAVGGRRHC
jgi:hypothetical protein